MKRHVIFIIITFIVFAIVYQKDFSFAQLLNKNISSQVITEVKADDASVEEFKKAFDQPKPIVVEFYSQWCGTCKLVKPVYNSVIPEYSDRISFFAFDVDKYPKLGDNFNVIFIPTIYAINPVNNEIQEIPSHYLGNKAAFSRKLDKVLEEFAVSE